MKKTTFIKALKAFKEEVFGAACFRDKATSNPHCANGLTNEEAQKFAERHNLELLSWQAGKSCSQVNCGA